MKPILCVIDLSESSANVLEVAAKMATLKKAHLTILFPYRLIDYGYNGEAGKLKAKLEQDARENFSLIKNKIASMNDLSYEFQPEIGFAGDRINSFVKKNNLDMIIISQRQANTISEINGMVLQHFIINSQIPFTIVPEKMGIGIFSPNI